MPFDIENMKTALQFGGDRPAHFEIRMTIPGLAAGNASASQEITFMCKAASIPGMNLGVVQVPYFGRKIPMHGDRVWDQWQTTIINDEDYLVRRALEQWNHRINAVRRNTTVAPITASPASYRTDASVYKYGKAANLLRLYKLVGVWPVSISPIDLSWEATDQIVDFTVVWAFDHMETDDNLPGGEGSGLAAVGAQ